MGVKKIAELVDKNAYMQVLGSLLKQPALISEVGLSLTESDFDTRFLKSIFGAIKNLLSGEALSVSIIDIDNYLQQYDVLYAEFQRGNGIQYLQDCEDLAQVSNFKYYRERVRKFSALRALVKAGFNVDSIYKEDINNPREEQKIREKFDRMSVSDIFNVVNGAIADVEYKYTSSDSRVAGDASHDIDSLVAELRKTPEIGLPLQGESFNSVIRGARFGKFYIRSASTSVGKSRLMAGDAARLAYPWRYSTITKKWEKLPYPPQKVLFISTELELDEIKTLILAAVSGINEEKILYGTYDAEEEIRIKKTVEMLKEYKGHLFLEQIPNPTIEGVRAIIRKHAHTNGVKYIFYDYIFASSGLLGEFRDIEVRTDQALALFSTMLKDEAVDNNVFVMTSTQLSGGFDDAKGIRSQVFLRDSKAVADKADVAVITSRVRNEELILLDSLIKKSGMPAPNMVTDVYKVRRGRYTQVKIWSLADLGTCRIEDLLVTDGFLNPVEVPTIRLVFEEEAFVAPEEREGEELNLVTGEITPTKGRLSSLL